MRAATYIFGSGPIKKPLDWPLSVCQLMTKSHLQDGTEHAVFIPEVAKQHNVLVCAIAIENSSALVLVFDWMKEFKDSSSAAKKICQNRHLFPGCYGMLLHRSFYFRLTVPPPSQLYESRPVAQELGRGDLYYM